MQTIKCDSELMQRSGLIDYSIFLVEVNSHDINSNNKILKAIVYNLTSMNYVMKEVKNANRSLPSSLLNSPEKRKAEEPLSTTLQTEVESRMTTTKSKTKTGFKVFQSRDGSTFYKIGMIDFLTLYDNIKYMENQIKSTIHGVESNEVSATDPATYKERFDEFMLKYF